MVPSLPYGGQEIATLRANRKKPADMVIVSLVGPIREKNPLVIAQPSRNYDWRFLSGLDVLIVANTSIDKSLVKRVSEAIAQFTPSYLGVWFNDAQNGLHLAWGNFKPRNRTMYLSDRKLMQGVGA